LLLLTVWAGAPWIATLAALAAVLGLREVYHLSSAAGVRPFPLAGTGWAVALIAFSSVYGAWIVSPVLGGGALAMAVLALARERSRAALSRWTFTTIGALYLGLPLTWAVLLRQDDQGAEWLLLTILATFATDTAAYVVGKPLGRHRMIPALSPGKSWEGALGGLLGGTGATLGLVYLLDLSSVVWPAVALGAGIGVVAQLGDLAESKLKRLAGAKESGQLIPGHGGMLDRLDSLVFVFPLVYHVSRIWPEA
jgi:phosphatidate cytidylyltransferase